MTTYSEDEESVESSQPRELLTLLVNGGVTTYRHTSASQDIVYNGRLYEAIAVDRSELSVQTPTTETELVVSLPITHPLVKRYTAQLAPQMLITVTLQRMQSGGGVQTAWIGDVTGMSFDGSVAKLRVPSRAGQWLLRVLPTVNVSDGCVHVLYDTACRASRDGSSPGGLAHKATTTVLAVNGREVRLDLGHLDRNDDWAEDGDLLHPASGERRSIELQVDDATGTSTIATLTMGLVIPELKVGDSVSVFAGCPHDIFSCDSIFGNRHNYLGWHLKPAIDYFSPVADGART